MRLNFNYSVESNLWYYRFGMLSTIPQNSVFHRLQHSILFYDNVPRVDCLYSQRLEEYTNLRFYVLLCYSSFLQSVVSIIVQIHSIMNQYYNFWLILNVNILINLIDLSLVSDRSLIVLCAKFNYKSNYTLIW